MRDADIPLLDRIKLAIARIANGQASMRVPVEATDPDMVLSDCAKRIADLEDQLRLANIDNANTMAENAELKADAERYRWLRSNSDDEGFWNCHEKDGYGGQVLRLEADLDAAIDQARLIEK